MTATPVDDRLATGSDAGVAPSAALLRAMLAADGDLVVMTDRTDAMVWVSPAVERVLGWSAERYPHVAPYVLHPADEGDLARARDELRGVPGHHLVGEVRQMGEDGLWRHLEVTCVNLLADHDVLVWRYRDLTHRFDAEDVDAQPLDAVTALPGRAAVERSLADRLGADGQAAHDDRSVAVLFLDLDGFKMVNDCFGHAAGDQTLRLVAERFRSRLRDTELLARWGGDEFVVLLDVPGPALAINVAARLHAAVTEQPFEIAGQPVDLGLSVGVAVGSPTDLADDLVEAADRAMYAAKRRGGGIVTADEIAA